MPAALDASTEAERTKPLTFKALSPAKIEELWHALRSHESKGIRKRLSRVLGGSGFWVLGIWGGGGEPVFFFFAVGAFLLWVLFSGAAPGE